MRFTMPAFFQTCEQVDISVAHHTLSVYPRSKEHLIYINTMLNNPYIKYSMAQSGGYSAGIISDSDDIFNSYIEVKFPSHINENILHQFLIILAGFHVISSDEKERVIHAHCAASQNMREQFKNALNCVREKAEKLAKKAEKDPANYELAAETASQLHEKLHDAAEYYFNNKSAENYEWFKCVCQYEIVEARKVLDRHRGWKPFLINLGATIASFGVVNLINYFHNNGNLFFQLKTESSLQLDKLERAQMHFVPI